LEGPKEAKEDLVMKRYGKIDPGGEKVGSLILLHQGLRQTIPAGGKAQDRVSQRRIFSYKKKESREDWKGGGHDSGKRPGGNGPELRRWG